MFVWKKWERYHRRYSYIKKYYKMLALFGIIPLFISIREVQT